MARLGQPVVVENRPGGNTLIGVRAVVDAPPDGYTLAYIASGVTQLPVTSKSFDVDPSKQLAPISQVLDFPLALAISPKKYPNVKTLGEFLGLAKNAPGKFNFATIGTTSGDSILMKMLCRMAGVQAEFINYKGGIATTQAVISGDADATTVAPQTALAIVQQGSLKLVGITGAKRFRMLQDVPTFTEAGFPGINITTWFGIAAPAGTPREIVSTLYTAIAISLRSASVEKALVDSGTDVVGSTPEQFAKLIASELAMYRKMVADGLVKPE
jgi:tripartite-type tricarboxylate transporter receptor subunit TctC